MIDCAEVKVSFIAILSGLSCLACAGLACNGGGSDDSSSPGTSATATETSGDTGSSSGSTSTGSGATTPSTAGSGVDSTTSGTSGEPTTTAATSATTGGGLTLGDCSMYADVDAFHAHINTQRQSYIPHDRYKGLPWKGEYHTMATFAAQFTFDDGLAASAQAEAEALVAGANPQGSMEIGGNGICTSDPMWIDALNTADWRISLFENAGSWVKPSESCPAPFPLIPENPDARMALFYHDFGGDGPAIGRVGIGAAFDDDCNVWWVLQFGA